MSTLITARKAWNSSGFKFPDGATKDDVIKAEPINFLVSKEQAYTQDLLPIPRKFAMIRDTPKRQPVGCVGKIFKPVQNHTSIELVNEVAGNDIIWHSCNSIGDGEAIWVLAEIPGEIEVVKGDKIKRFVLLLNRHDGQASIQMMLCPISESTGVTYNFAVNSGLRKRAKARHTTSVIERLTDIELFMRDAIDSFSLFESRSKELASIQIQKVMLDQYFRLMIKKVYSNPDAKKSAARVGDTTMLLNNLFSKAVVGAQGTAWAAFNAVAEYADFYKPTRKMNGNSEDTQRTKSILYGDIRKYKQAAFDMISQMVGLK